MVSRPPRLVWLPLEVASGTPSHLPCRVCTAGRPFLSPGSVILSAMGAVDHPWRRLRDEHPDWTVRWARLPDGLLGVTGHQRKLIFLDERMLQAERRCTLAHELERVKRGPAPATPILAAREEAVVDLVASRQLIRLSQLEDALAWSRCPAEAAEVAPGGSRYRVARLP